MINSINKNSFGAGNYALAAQNPDKEQQRYAPQMQQPKQDSFVKKHKDGRSFWERNLAAILGITSIAFLGMSLLNARRASNRKIGNFIGDQTANGKQNFVEIIEKFVPTKQSPKNLDDVIGMDEEKKKLTRLILNPLKSTETKKIYIDQYGLNMPSGILLEGAPGNGKTFLMEALSGELGCDLYKLNMSELGSKYLHETGENIAKMMKEIKIKAENNPEKPIILFLDELDGLARARTGDAKSHELEELNTILQNINNLQDHNIILVGATNRKDLIDSAILRPGRFAEHIFVNNPNEKAREALLTRFLKGRPKAEEFLKNKKQISEAVDNLEDLSNAEIKYVVDNAARLAFEDNKSVITKKHIEKATADFKISREKEV